MKYLFTVIALCAFNFSYAQKFEWNTKSVEPMAQEVNPNDPIRAAFNKAYNERQTGMAGVYNPNSQGDRTAYGETYANKQMTASHPVLPLGTIVRVQNLDNGKVISVRINDRGQECADCLLMLSQAAATNLDITYRGRIAVERTGFSNWNPAPPTAQVAYAPTPQAYGNQPAYQQPAQVTRPVEINGNTQWGSRGTTPSPTAYGNTSQPTAYGNANQPTAYGNTNQPTAYGNANRPAAYGQTSARRPQTYNAPANNRNYAVLSAPRTPSVASREVQPASVYRQPQTYSRYPTATTSVPVPATNQPRVYQPTQRTYGSQQPAYQQPVPVARQATPPASTVKRYQESRTVPAPATYNTPAATAPRRYTPPAGQMTARGVATPAVATPAAPTSGYAVQLGAYNNETYAKARVDQLKQMGLSNIFYKSTQKPDGQMINRVYAGSFGSMAEAQTASRLIQGNYNIAGIVAAL